MPTFPPTRLSSNTNDVLHNLFESLTNRMNSSALHSSAEGSTVSHSCPNSILSTRDLLSHGFLCSTRGGERQNKPFERSRCSRARTRSYPVRAVESPPQALALSQDLTTSQEPKCELSFALSSLAFGSAQSLLVHPEEGVVVVRNHATF